MLILLTMASHYAAHAQPYRPMLGQGTRWGELFTFETTTTCVRQIAGDSMINGQTYMRVAINGYPAMEEVVLLREDTAQRKVYFLFEANEELVLYDFSMQPGDMDTVYSEPIVLDSISAYPPAGVEVLFADPRFYYGHGFGNGSPFIWLEGVGSVWGLEVSYPNPLVSAGNFLTCHADSTGLVDYTGLYFWNLDSCFEIFFDNSIPDNTGAQFTVGPVPSSGQMFIQWSDTPVQNGVFTLLNASGKVVRSFQPGGSNVGIDLDISEQPSGLYLLRYTDLEGTRWESKILKD